MTKQITVISGKGGTGKTTVTSSLAFLAQEDVVMADCDVDAPDLHLILQPENIGQEEIYITKKVRRIEEKCIRCNLCGEKCRFGAIDAYNINDFKCEGCGLCVQICPEDALYLEKILTGTIYDATTRFGPMIHARMTIGEGNSGRLVDQVRKRAQKKADTLEKQYIIVDGSPGIGCPVIASITGVDLALIVVEPTLSGIHDLERVLDVTKHFQVKAMVCINKYDLNQENTQKIEEYCKKEEISVAGTIPFDPVVPQSIIAQKTILEMDNESLKDNLREIWKNIQEQLNKH
ncbi:MAG: P-loop NTPase [Candidatus Heimdallarchaeota archaeon]|nr:P-loop NTPase [Candidatus Heimdallarchaeota archaeon]